VRSWVSGQEWKGGRIPIDLETLQIYNAHAATLAATYRSLVPDRLHQLLMTFLRAGALSADIGCGSGRDVAWLTANGFPAVGWDASEGMLAEARRAFPSLELGLAALPDLQPVPTEHYDNVLCDATLMHVRREDLITAVLNLARILKPGGRLVISVWGSRSEAEREADGRLFTALPPGKLALLLESAGLQVIHREQTPDTIRANVAWWVLVAERNPASASSGLERVQRVLVPLGPIAVHWLRYAGAVLPRHQTFPSPPAGCWRERAQHGRGAAAAVRGEGAPGVRLEWRKVEHHVPGGPRHPLFGLGQQ